jgi:hypothetical protein
VTFVAGTLSITVRPLTITAENESKIYGTADPTLAYSIGGGGFGGGQVRITPRDK